MIEKRHARGVNEVVKFKVYRTRMKMVKVSEERSKFNVIYGNVKGIEIYRLMQVKKGTCDMGEQGGN